MKTLLDAIGNTPLVPLRVMVPDGSAEVWAKLEGFNPGGSVKDRIALSMITAGEKSGLLKRGGLIVEPTSGNTGIGLAMVARIKGYRMILTMPDTMSLERRQLLSALGAELVLTPGKEAMGGAVKAAEAIQGENPGSYMPQQFNNPANPDIHRTTTALEIIEQINGRIDGFVAGVGTGGTITGVGEVLKEHYGGTQVFAIEPDTSAVLSGEGPGPHKIAGIGAGFVPEVLNTGIYDHIIRVNDADAAATTRDLARREGLFVGISSGAAVWAALRAAERLGAGKKVVVILPDRGDRYLSTGLFTVEETNQ